LLQVPSGACRSSIALAHQMPGGACRMPWLPGAPNRMLLAAPIASSTGSAAVTSGDRALGGCRATFGAARRASAASAKVKAEGSPVAR
jgi:hypothetical protein